MVSFSLDNAQSDEHVTEWLADDVAGAEEGRIFVAHMAEPRCFGELVPDGKDLVSDVSYIVPCGEVLCRVDWIDQPRDDQIRPMLETLSHAFCHYLTVQGSRVANFDDEA